MQHLMISGLNWIPFISLHKYKISNKHQSIMKHLNLPFIRLFVHSFICFFIHSLSVFHSFHLWIQMENLYYNVQLLSYCKVSAIKTFVFTAFCCGNLNNCIYSSCIYILLSTSFVVDNYSLLYTFLQSNKSIRLPNIYCTGNVIRCAFQFKLNLKI
jgi:uncharacterized PurR-regulated membrane protein YhhQ (DUF165 family)